MAKRGDPRALRLLVGWLRSIPKWTQARFADASGIRQSDVSRYEQGIDVPSEEVLRRMARAAAVPWPAVVQVRRVFTAALRLADRELRGRSGAVHDELGRAWGEVITLALTPYHIEEAAAELSDELLRRDAAEIWQALAPFPADRRLVLLRAYPGDARRFEALIEQICMASRRRAANDPREALQLAELALEVVDLAGFDDGRRSLGAAYVWGFIGNGWRVANELATADAAFRRAEEFRKAGKGCVTELLDLNRLLDLEASLRKDQQRYPEALALLETAQAGASTDGAIGHILLNKEHVFERMGDYEGALAVLSAARPHIERSDEPRLRFALYFNTADNLCHLERYEEALDLLPDIEELAGRAGNALDQIRVQWLEARVLAGRGAEEQALAALKEVYAVFIREQLPYDAALSGLDLAALLLRSGRTADVRELAGEMTSIFAMYGIRREALASLSLFCEAAKRETATVELVRRVMREVERGR